MHQDWFEKVYEEHFERRHVDYVGVRPQRPAPSPDLKEVRAKRAQFSIGCPVPAGQRLPPRRTVRWSAGGRCVHRADRIPTHDEVMRLIRPGNSPYEIRCAAFVSLAVWSGIRHAKDILELERGALHNLRLPKEAWKPIVELVLVRMRRGVGGDQRNLFCTFRHGGGHQLHRRDFERRMVRFQVNRGIAWPHTFTGMRQSSCLGDAARVTMQEYGEMVAAG